MGIIVIDSSNVNEEEIKEKVHNMSNEELIKYHKANWSDYADSMNWGYCHDCNSFQDACGQGCPCWHWRISDDEMDVRGLNK